MLNDIYFFPITKGIPRRRGDCQSTAQLPRAQEEEAEEAEGQVWIEMVNFKSICNLFIFHRSGKDGEADSRMEERTQQVDA